MITLPTPTREVVPRPTREVVPRHSFAYTIEEATVHTQKGDAVVSKFVLGDVSHRDVADLRVCQENG